MHTSWLGDLGLSVRLWRHLCKLLLVDYVVVSMLWLFDNVFKFTSSLCAYVSTQFDEWLLES